ncbi:MAG: hypothetical protein ACD_49C00043G0003 [uncultured bacterium (gcode 4)]|uniref:DUF86 domain-containing protein n=1 Tax=uncultured bacterium (gcode 4) TaxID=1234023 RepID=K2AXD0_9BACT|nr:MAG: hypothetical protein ACD_49C00043G0003 [uncultured bacterium (gcode 4)]
MKKDTKFYEIEILNSISKIERYIWKMNFPEFSNDEKTYDACCMQLQHIWECWTKLLKITWSDYKGIPLEQMSGFRNRISHDYAWIDDDIVWAIIIKSLPKLKKILK